MENPLIGRWGNRDNDDFLYQIAFDFVAQLKDILESDGIGRAELARKLGVSKGRVSQFLNDPGNMELKNVVQYVRALGRKVAIVAYDDGDKDNDKGPINPHIFAVCWEKCRKPADLFEVEALTADTSVVEVDQKKWGKPPRISTDDFDAELEDLDIDLRFLQRLGVEGIDHARTDADNV